LTAQRATDRSFTREPAHRDPRRLRRRVKPGDCRVVARRSQNMNAIVILNDAPIAGIYF
jgi:hypothetical protein